MNHDLKTGVPLDKDVRDSLLRYEKLISNDPASKVQPCPTFSEFSS